MKNKILSVFLAVMLLLACFTPAALAAETSEHDHDHGVELYADTTFEAAANAYKNAVANLKNFVSGTSYAYTQASSAALDAVATAYDAMVDASEVPSDYQTVMQSIFEGTTTYEGYYAVQVGAFNTAAQTKVSVYKQWFDDAKTKATAFGVASSEYASSYSKAQAAYLVLLPTEVAGLGTYAFATLAAPTTGGGSGGSTPDVPTTSTVVAEIQRATTLTALINAVNNAAAKMNSLTAEEKVKVDEAQRVVSYLRKVYSDVLVSISETSLGASETVYNQYRAFNDFQKGLCANITDVNNNVFIGVCEVATAFYNWTGSSDANIINIYTAFNALVNPDVYCKTSLREAIANAYQTFMTECNMSVTASSFDTNTNRFSVTVNLSAGYSVTSARVILDISGIWFTSAWLGSINVGNTLVTSTNYNSGVLEVNLGAFTGYTATVTIGLVVPSDFSEKEINIGISGTVNSLTSSSDVRDSVKVLCCSHRVGGALVYESKTLKKPTCSEAGLIGYFCKLCGARLTVADGAPGDVPLLSSAHTPGEKVLAGVTNKPSTCTTTGIQYFECADCHAVITKGVTLPASHKVNVNTIVWNATTNTWNANCTGCAAVFDASLSKNTCTCETTYGKSFAKVIASKAATCGVRGYQVYQCQVCTVTWVESFGQLLENHTWGAWVITTPATCTTAGVETSTCSVCNQTKTQPIAILGHNYVVESYTPSTCVLQGTAKQKCSTCGATNEYLLELADHTYVDGVVTTPATCAATGVKEFTCTVCNVAKKTEVIAIDPNNHVELVTTTVTAPTCLKDGLDLTTCTSCEYKLETVTEATGHNWQTVTNENKLTEKKCLNCKSIWSQKETRKATVLSITSASHFTFTIANSDIAEKAVEFVVETADLADSWVDAFNTWYDEGKYDATFYGAYTAELLIDGEKASATEDMSFVINLGEDYKKTEFFVVAINDDNTFEKVTAERDGATIVISGEDYNGLSDKTFVVMTSNDKAGSSPVVAIIICVAVVAIAGIAVVLLLTAKGDKKKGFRV